MTSAQQTSEKRVIISGVGLIGGSIGAALRSRCMDVEVIGVGRSPERLQRAQEAGLIHRWVTGFSEELLAESCVVVSCLPVDLIASQVAEVSRLAGPDVLMTDAGSVKSSICSAVCKDPAAAPFFVGAHPIAGGEQHGWQYATDDLFEGRICVVVPSQDETRTVRAERFWQSIGCITRRMSAQEHDRILALTSHLPHLMAAVTTAVAGVENLELTGSGFRDTTRIAAGNPALWRAILSANGTEVVRAIDAAVELLQQYRDRLSHGDERAVEQLLKHASDCRNRLA